MFLCEWQLSVHLLRNTCISIPDVVAAVGSYVKNGISVPDVSGCCQFCQEWCKCSCCEWQLSVHLSRSISVPDMSGCCQFFCQDCYECSCCKWLLSVPL